MRGATSGHLYRQPVGNNFNPRTPCGVRPLDDFHGGDPRRISIHAPHAGCDQGRRDASERRKRFQSTHPMRGATRPGYRPGGDGGNFNPRTPCGVRRLHEGEGEKRYLISIHAPHAGCDNNGRYRIPRAEFQSTHPMRGATLRSRLDSSTSIISIHAPHAGCDGTTWRLRTLSGNFNPRTPCGVRHHPANYPGGDHRFQSTHPMRGATNVFLTSFSASRHFNPRTPCGVRPG